jgi:glycyl-tRNA synthetase beta chain
MMNKENLLIEIGTEELPPKVLKRLASAFAGEIHLGLEGAKLEHGECPWYATPRRLAVHVNELITLQEDKEIERRGPALSAAYDDDGNATKAAEGFARSCGVSVKELQTLETDKGSWLSYKAVEAGIATKDLLENIINTALGKLPIPKRMRWGSGDTEFVRPVHWVLVLFGEQAVSCKILDLDAGSLSYGHRFHAPEAISLASTNEYLDKLEKQGKVIAEFDKRQSLIRNGVEACASELGGIAIIDSSLLDEVCALVEWPVIISGGFDKSFLELPNEVLIASMQDHQKYFPVKDATGQLMPHFITVVNIQSNSPEEISKGNERVIFPRLSDAAFFWQRDIAQPLSEHQAGLKNIIYQKQLGSLHDKSSRVAELASYLAGQLGINEEAIRRAALLAKCDLSSAMVGEFPELQGVMGRYYALQSGEAAEVALALDEQYMPRFAGDALPSEKLGQALALAEKLDTLVGIFAIGQVPSGDKDPFGLRRAAIGCLRIIIECELDFDLRACLQTSAAQFDSAISAKDVTAAVFDFIMQRLRRYYVDIDITNDIFESVLALSPTNLTDFQHRVQAVNKFKGLDEAESLAAANKRIQNILKQNQSQKIADIDTALLGEPAEKLLASALTEIDKSVQPLLEKQDYASALTKLAELRDPIDNFFDEVMVMCEDEALKLNRLALLNQINTLFLTSADISKLQAQQNK